MRTSRNKISEDEAQLTLQDPKVKRLISEINILNEQLGRNIPTSQDSVIVEAFSEYSTNPQEQKEQQTHKYGTLKDFDNSNNKQQGTEQEF